MYIIMLALHASEQKSSYWSPLPIYCNWGDCGAMWQGQGDGGREEREFCAWSWMSPVLCIPIVCPRRIESSNQMRFCNQRPPWAKVDFQSWTNRIIAFTVGEQKEERIKEIEWVKIKCKYRAWSNHFAFGDRWLMCHSSFQPVKGLIAKGEWIIWVWCTLKEPEAAAWEAISRRHHLSINLRAAYLIMAPSASRFLNMRAAGWFSSLSAQ